uniref:Uncharacterized protein n=1 Tax=Arundo donax TaxID=35708 RepID=A0A0A9HI07_ARUDO
MSVCRSLNKMALVQFLVWLASSKRIRIVQYDMYYKC